MSIDTFEEVEVEHASPAKFMNAFGNLGLPLANQVSGLGSRAQTWLNKMPLDEAGMTGGCRASNGRRRRRMVSHIGLRNSDIATTELAEHNYRAQDRAGPTRSVATSVLCLVSMIVSTLLGASTAWTQSASTREFPVPSDLSLALNERLPSEHLFGDWGGFRTSLEARGVVLTPNIITESAGVASGGLRHGADYAHSVNLQGDVDLAKLAGLEGLGVHYLVVNRAGRNASSDDLDEHITQVQEIYGGGGDVPAHLGFAYFEQKLLDDRISIAAGRLGVGQEFAVSPLYCEFLTSSVCPNPGGLLLQPGFTTFITTTWGTRARLQLAKPFFVEAGAFQVRPEAGGRSGFDFSFRDTVGTLYALDAEYVPVLGTAELVGHYKVGALFNTQAVPLLSQAATGGSPQSQQGQLSLYGLADQVLHRPNDDGSGIVVAYSGYTWEDPRTSVIEQSAFAGVLRSGVLPGRPKDNVGVQVSALKVSGRLTATQILQGSEGQVLSSGLPGPGANPAGPQTNEIIFEGRYDVRIVEGLHLVPDVQYVVRPNATDRIRNALVLGIRTRVDF